MSFVEKSLGILMSVAPAYIYNVKFKRMFSLQTTEFDYTFPDIRRIE